MDKEVKAGLDRHLAIAVQQGLDVLGIADEDEGRGDAGYAELEDVAVAVKQAAKQVVVLLEVGRAPLRVEQLEEGVGRDLGERPRSLVAQRRSRLHLSRQSEGSTNERYCMLCVVTG